MDTLEKLSRAYDVLQELNILTTRGNMEKIMFALMAIKEAYDKLTEIAKQDEEKQEKEKAEEQKPDETKKGR